MSRVAKKPVAIAKGVEINVQGGTVNVKGPKGTLSIAKPEGVDVVIENGQAQMSTADASLVPMAGTLRAILANMVQGVSEGFVRKLELVGVGYRASMQGQDLNLALPHIKQLDFINETVDGPFNTISNAIFEQLHGAANAAVVAAVAKAFGVRPAQVRLISGERARTKVVELRPAPPAAEQVLAQLLAR